MSTNSSRTSARKAKRSFSLSKQSVQYLEGLRKKHRARSVSAVLEDLVQEARRQEQTRDYEAEATAYYDSITEEEREEGRAWGALGEQALASIEWEPPLE